MYYRLIIRIIKKSRRLRGDSFRKLHKEDEEAKEDE
jgi:hypothetical protein